MTLQVQLMKEYLLNREYRKLRNTETYDISDKAVGKTELEICELFLREMLNRQQPVIAEHDIFGFNRSTAKRPICTLENGTPFYSRVYNVTPAYQLLIDRGIDAVLSDIRMKLPDADSQQREFYLSAVNHLNLILALCDKYRNAAATQGNRRLFDALCQVPRKKPTSFYEACLFQKILIFVMRCAGHNHLTLGRFDQYMYPYYEADLRRGVSREDLLETLELYFISLNIDGDLYHGVQQGDNGQSMVLGGFDPNGHDMFNPLSELCMEASLELNLIDPKINLRVGKNTPDALYALGTRLTKKGLGFPQYCNDDVVIPGLIKLGYRPEDAADYAVAACWEFTIPGHGVDIPNLRTFNFPLVISSVLDNHLMECSDFDELMAHTDRAILLETEQLTVPFNTKDTYYYKRKIPTSPLLSLLTHGCLEEGRDISEFSARYYNLGCHGAGISTAADSLAAVKKLVFDEKSVTKQELLDALHDNFEHHTTLRNQLLACPKMGNDDDYVDDIAIQLMSSFSNHMNGRPTGTGGVWRAGTGSAQEYINSSKKCPATPDGRLNGEPYASSFSPSLGAKLNGPLSVISSFTKCDLTNCINGGPLTLEIHDNVFRNAEGEKKVAALVKLFVLSGGHQLQLNSINRERLLDAQKHPEKYPNLIVRVWGWSGYFCELDPAYQSHIIQRTEFLV